jgi:diaminopimelate epimerase
MESAVPDAADQTGRGIDGRCEVKSGKVIVRVNMGSQFCRREIPTKLVGNPRWCAVGVDDRTFQVRACHWNHCVTYVEQATESWFWEGRKNRASPMFPARVNASSSKYSRAKCVNGHGRGSGETLACGTGAGVCGRCLRDRARIVNHCATFKLEARG